MSTPAPRPGPLLPGPIGTDRLVLVPLRAEHADEMAGVLADPGLYRFTGGAPPTPEALRSRYARMAAGSPDPAVAWCNWLIGLRDEGRLTGTVQATVTYPAVTGRDPVAEIAWVVGAPWQGRGIATEAARGLAGWLADRSVHRLVAHIHPDHHASAAVARAVGLAPTPYVQDGEIRWARRPDGGHHPPGGGADADHPAPS
ncbi:GNAT family N-acetyltransferase [Streptomyces sp. NPDC049879]|uniref:GNAT family N-acetyltransferase n=1 Tax=Streptomyces sp. NPDC049879 TaxID=3365598 RepID=UPI00379F3C11